MTNRRRHFDSIVQFPRPSAEESVPPLCPIGNKSVDLKAAKADENGLAMHEECYVVKVRLENTATPLPLRKPSVASRS